MLKKQIHREGKHINSGELDGLENEAAITKAIQLLEQKRCWKES